MACAGEGTGCFLCLVLDTTLDTTLEELVVGSVAGYTYSWSASSFDYRSKRYEQNNKRHNPDLRVGVSGQGVDGQSLWSTATYRVDLSEDSWAW